MNCKLKRYHGGIGSTQLANLIKANPRTVRRWASRDLIPHGKSLGGHHYRFSPTQVEEIKKLVVCETEAE